MIRGVIIIRCPDGSKVRHKSTQQYYRDIQKLADKLKAEVVDLQQQKDPTDGTKLVLAIDRKPIAEWFKDAYG